MLPSDHSAVNCLHSNLLIRNSIFKCLQIYADLGFRTKLEIGAKLKVATVWMTLTPEVDGLP